MKPRELRQLSKRLSWLLRHGAPEAGVAVDPAGWVEVDAVLAALKIDRASLLAAVEDNNKNRLQLDGARIRACQGHSSAMPVALDALEASWSTWTGSTPLWHGTRREVLDAIRTDGLTPQARTHVHLAAARDARVGKRANVQVLLEIDPAAIRGAGLDIFEAPNGVVLTRRVPATAIAAVHDA